MQLKEVSQKRAWKIVPKSPLKELYVLQVFICYLSMSSQLLRMDEQQHFKNRQQYNQQNLVVEKNHNNRYASHLLRSIPDSEILITSKKVH